MFWIHVYYSPAKTQPHIDMDEFLKYLDHNYHRYPDRDLIPPELEPHNLHQFDWVALAKKGIIIGDDPASVSIVTTVGETTKVFHYSPTSRWVTVNYQDSSTRYLTRSPH